MQISVKRFDPSTDVAPYVKTYEVPYREYMTVLEALVYIDENIEPIAFDYSCGGRACGRCAIMLDGEPILACATGIKDRDCLLEPLAGFPIVRDLVVDRDAMRHRVANIATRVRPTAMTAEEHDAPVDYEGVYLKVNALEWCTRCMMCATTCLALHDPASPGQYIGPAGMVAIALRHYDPYDTGDRIGQAVQEGLWNCLMCGKCDEVCPSKEIKHLETWTNLRSEAAEKGLVEEKQPLLLFGN